jgi:hypothetical protein
MATINLGSIKFKWQGAYAGGTAYTVDDVVSYNGSSYICIQASTGNLPTNATYFEQMSQAGTDGTDLTTTLTTQGDILYRDGSGLQRLGAGTSGQALITNGTGANPSWGDVSGGLLQVVQTNQNQQFQTTSTSFVASNVSLNITPSSTSSKILLMFNGLVHTPVNSVEVTIYRDGSNMISSPNKFVRINTDSAYDPPTTIMYLDSPSTTSQITYTIYIKSSGGSGPVYIDGNTAHSVFIAQEIGV